MSAPPKDDPGKWRFAAMVLGVCLVALVGSGYAMRATDTPQFCGSCHTMEEQVRSHTRSLHAKLACNECHAPHALLEKIPFKTAAGLHDMYRTVAKQLSDVVHASKDQKEVVQENCYRCHRPTVENTNMTSKKYCIECHRSVPHKEREPIAKRKAADA